MTFFKLLTNMVQSAILLAISGVCTAALTVIGIYGVCRAHDAVCEKINQINVSGRVRQAYDTVRERINHTNVSTEKD